MRRDMPAGTEPNRTEHTVRLSSVVRGVGII